MMMMMLQILVVMIAVAIATRSSTMVLPVVQAFTITTTMTPLPVLKHPVQLLVSKASQSVRSSSSISSSSRSFTSNSALDMVPKYVGDRWVPQTDDDLPSAGYDVFGTLIRHGPKPTITRLTSPEDYQQSILKFMVSDQCNYRMAQGNMDAYIQNPPDWQYQRMQDIKNNYEKQRDYAPDIQIQDVVLVLTWSTIVIAVVARVIYSITNGVDFYDWGIGPFRGSY